MTPGENRIKKALGDHSQLIGSWAMSASPTMTEAIDRKSVV